MDHSYPRLLRQDRITGMINLVTLAALPELVLEDMKGLVAKEERLDEYRPFSGRP